MPPQLILPALSVTVPLPLPLLPTVKVGVIAVKVALTVLLPSTVSGQVGPPEHAPPQLVKVQPDAGVAVRLIAVL